ncbi:MAG: CopD family protein [Emcibacteraceae bacterium]|nr:CopD family protein [Emcibacteraceae bacterium]
MSGKFLMALAIIANSFLPMRICSGLASILVMFSKKSLLSSVDWKKEKGIILVRAFFLPQSLHLFVILFWFGALFPLYYVIKMEANQRAGQIVNDFSKKATLLVPLIFVAGIILSIILMDGPDFLSHPYDLILLSKIAIFSILMLIAALNKFRLGPDLELGKPNAARNLQSALVIEILLIFIIVGATTVLTGLFSPTLT